MPRRRDQRALPPCTLRDVHGGEVVDPHQRRRRTRVAAHQHLAQRFLAIRSVLPIRADDGLKAHVRLVELARVIRRQVAKQLERQSHCSVHGRKRMRREYRQEQRAVPSQHQQGRGGDHGPEHRTRARVVCAIGKGPRRYSRCLLYGRVLFRARVLAATLAGAVTGGTMYKCTLASTCRPTETAMLHSGRSAPPLPSSSL